MAAIARTCRKLTRAPSQIASPPLYLRHMEDHPTYSTEGGNYMHKSLSINVDRTKASRCKTP